MTARLMLRDGSWCHGADLDAETLHDLTPEDSAQIEKWCAAYAGVKLIAPDGRTLWRWETGDPLLHNAPEALPDAPPRAFVRDVARES
jgi:hypothetical protein